MVTQPVIKIVISMHGHSFIGQVPPSLFFLFVALFVIVWGRNEKKIDQRKP